MEDEVKSWLARRRIAVPRGGRASSPDAAADVGRDFDGGAVVKALIPAGRRGKAGAVRFCEDTAAIHRAATDMLGTVVNGHAVGAVYVEERLSLAAELYLAFYLESFPPQMLLSAEGGIDVEEVHARRPEAVRAVSIDPLKGVRPWQAIAQWERTSVKGGALPALGQFTTQLYEAFVAGGATMLEINPLGIDREGRCAVVGAMMATDDPSFARGAADEDRVDRPLTSRERRVREADASMPGGMMRLRELDGDIGMFIGGGGASLVQHDLVLGAGGRPANHMDASTANPDKVRVLVDAILDNPRVKGLLVSWHYQQMVQIDRRVGPIIQALKERKVDVESFPVVIRMFGPGEEAARRAASELPGVHYLPHGAPMEEGVRMIVDLMRRASETAAGS